MTIDFLTLANTHRDTLITRRRDFHRHPELGYEEVRTAGIVADVLRELQLEVQTGVGKTGVVGLLEGAHDGPTVLIRADMDALPVQEQNETDYASTVPGKMHACGHDGHTSVGLVVAEMLAGYRDRMAGRVKFIFQPAEEGGEGALAMIEDGALRDPKPDIALGLHFWSGLETGKISIGQGPIMAGADIFEIQIQGSGGHGALPEQTHDPIFAAAQIILALQSVVSRNVSPLDTAVLSVCHMHAGEAFNVIPDSAILKGTIRTYRPAVREMVIERAEAIVTNTARALDCEASIDVTQKTTPVHNDEGITHAVTQAVRGALGADRISETVRTMGAEDMCEILDRVPGCFFFIGSGSPDKKTEYPHHHPRFDLDEDALPVAAAAMAAAVARYILPES